MKCEKWKDIPDFEGYQASDTGKIRSVDRLVEQQKGKTKYCRKMRGRIIKPNIQNNGYFLVWLRLHGKTKAMLVHRLIAMTFMPHVNDRDDINHKDGNKLNNDLSNLEWCTRSENVKHAYKIGLRKLAQPTQEAPVATKRCNRCGRVLPLTMFHHARESRDGYYHQCKDCRNAIVNECKDKKKEQLRHTALHDFQPRELIADLRLRGYRGTLTYTETHEIKL